MAYAVVDRIGGARVLSVDVLVLGAGPAGAVAALNLAPLYQVAIVEQRAEPPQRIGESLPPAARRLLEAMGLWKAFLQQGHAPCHGNLSRWGGEEPTETDFLRDLDGHGWHLDRARYESWLRSAAVARGAALLCPATPRTVTRQGEMWRVLLDTAGGPLVIRARALIDASGRNAWLARHLGARRIADDRLVCGWARLDEPRGRPALTHVIAEADGWWYSAPLPGDRRVLAFHTDSDLDAARDAGDAERLIARARRLPAVAALLPPAAELTVAAHALVPASGGALAPLVGEAWAATGDAALSFDPLSSQGLLNSLFTGLAAAEAIARTLEGSSALLEYADTLGGIRRAYLDHLARWYAEEQRWPERPFWSRRQQPGATAATAMTAESAAEEPAASASSSAAMTATAVSATSSSAAPTTTR